MHNAYCVQIVPEMDGVVVAETVFSKRFLLHVMSSIDYPALVQTTKEVRHFMMLQWTGWIENGVVHAAEPSRCAGAA